jgi:hypothetical protein
MAIRLKTWFCIMRGCPLVFSDEEAPTCPLHDKEMQEIDLVEKRQMNGGR